MNKGAQLGGQEFVQQQLPLVQGMQADQNVANALAGRGPSAGPASNPAAAGPANVTQPSPQRGPSRAPAASGFSNAPATLSGIVSEFTAGRDISPDIVGKIGARLNLPTTGALSPADSARARAFLSQVALPAQGRAPTQQGQSQPPPQQQGDEAPFARGVSGSPGPAPEPAQSASPQSQGVDPTLNGLIPRSVIAQGLTAWDYRNRLLAVSTNPNSSPQAKAAVDAKIKAIDDTMAKTGAQWRTPNPLTAARR
jgi:hypothetical protein